MTLILLLFSGAGQAVAAGINFDNESLSYTISYKWGLVQKDAGKATLTLKHSGNNYEIILAARTLPWADKIFSVRDTLAAVISKADFKPATYIKTTHENGRYRKDVIRYTYMMNHVYGTCTRYKKNKGKLEKTVKKFSATGPTFDMLSIFYYVRSLDYNSMKPNTVKKAKLFSGSGTETLRIRNKGVEKVSVPAGKNFRCYHLVFSFTSDSGKESGVPMDVWVTADNAHIPVRFEGHLPIGKVRAFLTSAK